MRKGKASLLQKRNNKMLVPFLIAGELFVLFISYIISGVWKEGMEEKTLLNNINKKEN